MIIEKVCLETMRFELQGWADVVNGSFSELQFSRRLSELRFPDRALLD